jgi:hypothetical protein
MAEERYDRSHHAGGTPEARIAARLRNSGGDNLGEHTTKTGDGPNRVFHNIHSNAGQQHVKPGPDHTTPTPKERDTGRFADPQATMRKETENGR